MSKSEKTLDQMRGMSEPFGFTFNITDKVTKKLIIHAVIFSTFECDSSSEQSVNLPDPESDPRMAAFIKYVWTNFLKDKRAHYDKQFAKLDASLAQDNAFLKALDTQIKQLKHEHD